MEDIGCHLSFSLWSAKNTCNSNDKTFIVFSFQRWIAINLERVAVLVMCKVCVMVPYCDGIELIRGNCSKSRLLLKRWRL